MKWPRGFLIGIKNIMTLDEFSEISTHLKWTHIQQVMHYIQYMEQKYVICIKQNSNNHQGDKDDELRAIRLDQHQRWSHVKDLYVSNRDELSNTLEDKSFQECKNILERIFTIEIDQALYDILEKS